MTIPEADRSTVAGSRTPGRPRDERVTRAILETARRQLAELGYGRMSMETVAGAAGVSRASLYRRYRDKADLVTSAIAEGIASAPEPTGLEPLVAVAAFLERLEGRLAGECFEVLSSVLAAREDPGAISLHRDRIVVPRIAYLENLLVAAVRAGDLPTALDIRLAAEMLIGSIFTRRIAGTTASPGWPERALAMLAGTAMPAGNPARQRRVSTLAN